jgi:hypothetical protein
MLARQSVSSPSSTEAGAPERVAVPTARARLVVRALAGLWALAIYATYWLLTVRGAR